MAQPVAGGASPAVGVAVPRQREPRRPPSSQLWAPPGAGDVAGAILGVFAWLWVGLPLLTGGPTRVKDVLRAKFFNKDAKGNWLP